MKNYEINILDAKLKTVKTIDGSNSYSSAERFAKNEAQWRGTPVEVAWYDDVGNRYSRLYEPRLYEYRA